MKIIERATLLVVGSTILLASPSVIGDAQQVQLRLLDPLDEPEYYCLDVVGWGENLKLDDPLQAHTCKVDNHSDQVFSISGDNILVGTTGRCLEVAGGGSPLPGAAILARECTNGASQAFTMNESGRISMKGAELCLAVGDSSAETPGPSHVWRVLSVERCDAVPAELTTWQVGL